MIQRPLTTRLRRTASGLAAQTVAFVVFAAIAFAGLSVPTARAEPLQGPNTFILVADSSVAAFGLLGGSAVNDAILADMRGRGADLDIPFTQQTTGVVLWDEVGGRRGGANPVSGGSSGTGNSQSSSLQHR